MKKDENILELKLKFPISFRRSNTIEIHDNHMISIFNWESVFVRTEEKKFPGDDRTRIYEHKEIEYQFQIQNSDQLQTVQNINAITNLVSITIQFYLENGMRKVLNIESLTFDFDNCC
jgi:hypothetical protein